MISNIMKMVKRKHEPQSLSRAMCVLAMYNKIQAERISNREFKLWTILQGTEPRVATFHAETCGSAFKYVCFRDRCKVVILITNSSNRLIKCGSKLVEMSMIGINAGRVFSTSGRRLRRLAVACWTTDHYHPCSNLGVGISKGCFIFHFASLP